MIKPIPNEKKVLKRVNQYSSDMFFARFKGFLDDAGMTQATLAKKLNVSRQFIWKVAHAYDLPVPSMRKRIGEVMDKDSGIIWVLEDFGGDFKSK